MNPKIANGTPAGDSFPEVARLEIVHGDLVGTCTATWIGGHKLLTAAHCLVNAEDGTIDLPEEVSVISDFAGEQLVFSSVRIDVNPQYFAGDQEPTFGADGAINPYPVGDIAMVTTNEEFPGPRAVVSSAPVAVGDTVTLVGYGFDDGFLQTGLGTKRVGGAVVDELSAHAFFFTYDGINSNTCPGDSGGPAFLDIGGAQLLVGVTSNGSHSFCDVGDKSGDSRPDAYLDWVVSVAEGDISLL